MNIPHNRPWITAEDRRAVDAVLASGWIARGPAVAALEQAFVDLHGGGGACALSSGTAALALALRVLGVGAGMRVALPSYACSALLNAVYWVGAEPVPVDVTAGAFSLDPDLLPKVEAVIVVHTFGAAAPVAACRPRAGLVLEDCCHALGGSVSGLPMGESGDVAVYSFYASKIISGGQGGLLWSADPAWAAAARDYREFDGRDRYEPRFNFQWSDLQAGLALSQFSRLERIRQRRAELARRYAAALPAGLGRQAGFLDHESMVYRFVVRTPDAHTRDRLRDHMAARGVTCIVPIERFELLHRYLGLDPEAFPVSERLADTTLSLPLYPALSEAEAEHVAAALHAFQP